MVHVLIGKDLVKQRTQINEFLTAKGNGYKVNALVDKRN